MRNVTCTRDHDYFGDNAHKEHCNVSWSLEPRARKLCACECVRGAVYFVQSTDTTTGVAQPMSASRGKKQDWTRKNYAKQRRDRSTNWRTVAATKRLKRWGNTRKRTGRSEPQGLTQSLSMSCERDNQVTAERCDLSVCGKKGKGEERRICRDPDKCSITTYQTCKHH